MTAANAIAQDLGMDVMNQCMNMGIGVLQAMSTHDIPKITARLIDSCFKGDGSKDDKYDPGMRAKFVLIGYVLRNLAMDGYDLERGFMNPPALRSTIILPDSIKSRLN